jgi:branched-chain amino acid transport system permease protein
VRGAIFGVVCGVLLFLPLLMGTHLTFVVTLMMIYAVFAMAYDLALGYAGLWAFGHAAFFGVGGYTLALGIRWLGLGYWLAFVLGPVLGLMVAVIQMMFAMRTRAFYFLVVTMVAAQALWGLALRMSKITGGDQGVGGFGRPELFGMSLWSSYVLYYFVFVTFCLASVAMWLVTVSPFGLLMIGVRDNEARMLALGYSVKTIVITVFAISGLFAGLAGALASMAQTFVGPSALNWTTTTEVLLMVLVGGSGTLIGPMLGAFAVLGIKEVFQTYTNRWMLALGIAYMFTAFVGRRGLAGLFWIEGARSVATPRPAGTSMVGTQSLWPRKAGR